MNIDNDRMWLYLAIRTCRDIDSAGLVDAGCYMESSRRKYYAKLNEEKLIFSEPVAGKKDWVRFLGFSPRGRTLYLNSDGCIRDNYNLEEINREGIML